MTEQAIKSRKPLGRRAYGSIGHLPNSRLGPGDHCVNEGMARILTEKTRDQHDLIIVEEKLDGSNVAAARIGDEIVPLIRAGYLAETSPYPQHHVWAKWVRRYEDRFRAVLQDGERLCGEWIAQACGTLYEPDVPFVPFDIMRDSDRLLRSEFLERVERGSFRPAEVLHMGDACSVERAVELLNTYGHHGATEPVEGAVWRVERKGKVDFLAKYVRPDKVDGCYLPEVSGKPAVWNWPDTAREKGGTP